MKIVFLYSEPMPTVLVVIKELINKYFAEIHLVYWDHKKQTPFTPDGIEGVTYYRRSEYGFKMIRQLIANVKPDAIYVVGWMDYTYLAITAMNRHKGMPVFVGFDDIWHGNMRQSIARIASPLLTKVFFSHAWVSGPRQYEYAKRLGFDDRFIVSNLLSCDTKLFHKALLNLPAKKINYPKSFLFVGRFVPAKNISLLASAYEKYREYYKGDWQLICIGNGPLKDELRNRPGIDVRDFADQSELVQTMSRSGAFVLASVRDVSPVVVHEAASAGLPMILSSNIGNLPLFMINAYNGYVFESGSVDSLAFAFHRISKKTNDQLVEMGNNSYNLSQRVSPEIAAASFISALDTRDL